jgi:folylpolyglutamate synthase/dihydropteroate synthase
MIAALAGADALADARVVCTTVATGRSLEAEALAARWRVLAPDVPVAAEPDLDRALDRTLAAAPGPVVVAGSLYLVGAVRGRLVSDPELVDPPRAGA